MSVKEYLSRYCQTDQLINDKIEQLCELRAMAVRVSPGTDKDGTGKASADKDKLGRIVAKILDLENEIDSDIDRLVKIHHQIKSIIEAVKEPDLNVLLTKRYINGKTFEQIAEEMDLSERWIYKMHTKALKSIKIPKSSL